MTRRTLWLLALLLALVTSCTRDPKAKARRYVDNGNKFFAKGKFKEASIMYRSALKQDLRFGEAYYRLGLADLKLAAYGDAAQMLLRAVSLDPGNQDAATKLAELYLMVALKDPQHAGEMLNSARELAGKLVDRDPQSFEGHRLRGQIDLIEGKIPAAIQELAAANNIRPLQPDAVLAYVQALVADHRFPEAEKLAYELIGKEKEYSPIYDLLYLYYAKQNRLDDGERLLKLKVANNPKTASYLVQLATHYYLSQRRAEMDAVIQKLSDEKQFSDGHLLAGDFFLFRLRDFDRAEEQYNAAIKAFPKDKALYQKRIVELYASANRGADAERLLASVLKENPKDNDALAMRAALALATGDAARINAAASDLQALVNKNPSNYLLRFNLARALTAKKDFDQARLQLEEAIRLRPDFIPARELLGRVEISRGDSGGAVKAADDLIAIQPGDLQAHLVRSTGLLGLGQSDRARDELDLILKTYPQNVEARFQVAYLAWKQNDFKRSEQIFSEIHKADPKDLRGLVGWVETLAGENRMSQAIEETQKILDQDPSRADVRLVLANLLVRDQQYDRAVQQYRILLEKDPNSSSTWLRLGETYRLKGDLNAAIDALRRSSQADPKDFAALLQLGLLMDGTGHGDQAEPIYERILKIRPDQAVALNNLAFLKAEKGTDLDLALTMAQRALQQQPGSSDFADTLGWIYIKKNLSDNAVRIFSDLVAKQPANATYHYHFGLALLQKGDRPSARRELEAAMKNNPPQDERVKIQDALQKL
ncbi:MAG TPA: tetratricopeptide repeat protein [Bryobacteraceae bacterium]|nr:tetratricopeptide repeat protein [Bryobacteraceae bacterium]